MSNVTSLFEQIARRDAEIARLRDELDTRRKGWAEAMGQMAEANAELLAFVRKIADDGTMWPNERGEAKALVAKHGDNK